MLNTMSEEEKVRERYLRIGIIKLPAEKIPDGERPPMTREEVLNYRNKLIQLGLLRPGKHPPRPRRYH